jgi:hypothetical protein
VKHLSGAPHYGRLQTLLRNIRLGWEGLPGEKHYIIKINVNYSRKKVL